MVPASHAEGRAGGRRCPGMGFAWLLPILLVHLVVSGFPESRPLLWVLRTVVRACVFLMTIYVSMESRRWFLLMVILAFIASAASIPARGHPGLLQNLVLGAWSILLFLAPAMIFRRVRKDFQVEGVDLEVVLGALCAYLWIGGYFAFLFGAAATVFQMPFFVQPGAENQVNYLYFSFVTLTTTGYGDLTPAYGPGRMLAVTEAVIGQLYLVSVVSIVVSAFGRKNAPRS